MTRQLNIKKISGLKRIVIIGGGFAGLTLAQNLNHTKFQIVLIDQFSHHTFQPLLYQLATAQLSLDNIAHPIRLALKKKKNVHFRLASAQKILPTKHTLNTNKGPIEYDYLVIATGAKPSFFGLNNVQKHAYTLKTIEDALNLRSIIFKSLENKLSSSTGSKNRSLNITIIGGGPTGVELAGALGSIKKKLIPKEYPEFPAKNVLINLIEGGERVLHQMKETSSKATLNYLNDLDVNVFTNEEVKAYHNHQVFTTHNTISTDILIWAAGVTGNFFDGCDKEVIKGRLKTNTFSKVIGLEHIFAIGDVACMKTESYPEGHPMLAQTATQQAKHLAKNFKLMAMGSKMKPFKYRNKGIMAIVGGKNAVLETKNIKLHGRIAWLIWMIFHLFAINGVRNIVLTFFSWFWGAIGEKGSTRYIFSKIEKS